MFAVKCDRCKRVIESKEVLRLRLCSGVLSRLMQLRDEWDAESHTRFNIELCEACAAALKQFLGDERRWGSEDANG